MGSNQSNKINPTLSKLLECTGKCGANLAGSKDYEGCMLMTPNEFHPHWYCIKCVKSLDIKCWKTGKKDDLAKCTICKKIMDEDLCNGCSICRKFVCDDCGCSKCIDCHNHKNINSCRNADCPYSS